MPPDFLVVGHIVQDLIPGCNGEAWRLGGTASYASLLARNLGLRAAVLTAASADLPLKELLPGIDCRIVPSDCATRFRNVYSGGHRHQCAPQRAAAITPDHLPKEWRQTPIVLLGPVVGEVDETLARCFPGSLLGVSAQGWLREIAPDTQVRPLSPSRWQAASILRSTRVLFVSDEDMPPAEATAAIVEWSPLVEIVAFTRGAGGADIGHKGRWRHIDAFPAQAVDPTGAGDVFAAAFLIRLWEAEDVWEAARFAASMVVEGEGITAVPSRYQIEARLRQHPEIVCR